MVTGLPKLINNKVLSYTGAQILAQAGVYRAVCKEDEFSGLLLCFDPTKIIVVPRDNCSIGETVYMDPSTQTAPAFATWFNSKHVFVKIQGDSASIFPTAPELFVQNK